MTLGSQPARVFVVEWFDFAPYALSPRQERLQFQVKLFESSNKIEFHYCRLDALGGVSSNVDGSNAVVGLEDGAGSDRSVAWSNRKGNSVSTAQSLVFVPRP